MVLAMSELQIVPHGSSTHAENTNLIVWQYSSMWNGFWKDMPHHRKQDHETAYGKGVDVIQYIIHRNDRFHKYRADLRAMTQTNVTTGTTRQLRRLICGNGSAT